MPCKGWWIYCTVLHGPNTTLHHTTLHCTALHYTTLYYLYIHYTTLHYTALCIILSVICSWQSFGAAVVVIVTAVVGVVAVVVEFDLCFFIEKQMLASGRVSVAF